LWHHVASSDGGGSDEIIIGAAAGGSAVFVILLCSLVLVVMWYYKKHSNNADTNNSITKPNKNCDYIELAPGSEKTVKMDYNPSYGIIDKDGNAVKMESNPCYDVTNLSCEAVKLKWKTSDDQYNYVEPDEDPLFHHKEHTVKMQTNPSYQPTTGDYKTLSNDGYVTIVTDK